MTTYEQVLKQHFAAMQASRGKEEAERQLKATEVEIRERHPEWFNGTIKAEFLNKNDIINMKGRPCRVVEVNRSK